MPSPGRDRRLRAARIGRRLSSSAGSTRSADSRKRAQTRISSLSATVSNPAETSRLLAAAPQVAEIGAKLFEPLLLQHWDEPTQRAIWIASDGSRARCVTVTGLSTSEMADMWVSFNERLSRAKFNLSPQLVREIIEAEIDVSVVLVN